MKDGIIQLNRLFEKLDVMTHDLKSNNTQFCQSMEYIECLKEFREIFLRMQKNLDVMACTIEKNERLIH